MAVAGRGDLAGRAEWNSREASRETTDWLAEEEKLLEDGFPLKIGWAGRGPGCRGRLRRLSHSPAMAEGCRAG